MKIGYESWLIHKQPKMLIMQSVMLTVCEQIKVIISEIQQNMPEIEKSELKDLFKNIRMGGRLALD